jgi:hypothetical protein
MNNLVLRLARARRVALAAALIGAAVLPAAARRAHDPNFSPKGGGLTPAQIAMFGQSFELPPRPEITGAWTAPIYFPKQGSNAAVLPTGKVLFFGKRADVFGLLFDPVTGAITDMTPPGDWNPTCSGHVLMPDGRLLVYGGIHKLDSMIAHDETYYFDPFAEEWDQVGDVRRGRYYPSGVVMADGQVMLIGGSVDVIGHGTRNTDVEVFDPLGVGRWELVADHELDWYPLLHLMGDGTVFVSGPAQMSESYDPLTHRFTLVANRLVATRFYAPSVLLPPDSTSVAIFGGQVGYQAGGGIVTASVELIDFTEPTPAWRLTEPMHGIRVDHSAVILPDQTILVVGGRSTDGVTSPIVPIYTPEVFDPATETWTELGQHRHPRVQHSTTLLLPDARVISAGEPNTKSAEIFSPPYLFRGPRPVITSAPDELGYADTFSLGFTSETDANTVCLIRLSSVTHSVNFDQRYVLLGQHSASSSPATVATPPDSAKAPAGFYMLFVVDSDGVPSVSKIVQLR